MGKGLRLRGQCGPQVWLGWVPAGRHHWGWAAAERGGSQWGSYWQNRDAGTHTPRLPPPFPRPLEHRWEVLLQ